MNLYSSQIYQSDLDVSLEASVRKDLLIGKRVLVTGATGTIGSFIVDMLIRYSIVHDAEILVYAAARSLDRLETRFNGIDSEHLIFVEYDLMNSPVFPFSVDYVIHAAGNSHPAAFMNDPVGTILGNIRGTYDLLEYSRLCGASRFLYVSSGEVYGQGELSLGEFVESYGGYVDPLSPRSCYPSSKRTAETLCASYYRQYGLETVIARPCHTYGPWITMEDNRANVQFMRDVLRNEDVVLTSHGSQSRSYCYVADCASGIVTILLNGMSGEAYNCANPNSRVTIAGFAQVVANAAGKRVIFADPTEEEIAVRTPVSNQVLSSKKLEGLGWHPRFSISEGVSNTLAILQGR